MLIIRTQSKPKLNKHIKNTNIQINNKRRKSEKAKLELLPQHKNSPRA